MKSRFGDTAGVKIICLVSGDLDLGLGLYFNSFSVPAKVRMKKMSRRRRGLLIQEPSNQV